MNHLVYKTTNNINNKVYVGIHSTLNIKDGYLGSGTSLKKAVSKYGKDKFDRIILHNFNTRQEALNKEAEIVNHTFVLRKDTYNLVLGGGSPKTVNVNLTKEELRAIEKGFDNYKEFISFMMEFSNYITFLKYSLNQPLNLVEISMLKLYIKDGLKIEEKKLIKYQKYQSSIIKIIQYVVYGK